MMIRLLYLAVLVFAISAHAALLDDLVEKVRIYEKKYLHPIDHKYRYHRRNQTISEEMQYQKALRFLGYYKGKIDGDLLTQESYHAIDRFQHNYQDLANGILDECYKPYLSDIYTQLEFKEYLTYQGRDKRKLDQKTQTALKVMGYYTEKIDGKFGPKSKEALQRYLQDGLNKIVLYSEALEKVNEKLNSMKKKEYFSLHYSREEYETGLDDLIDMNISI
ncbi:hypothetical protein MNB_SV-10-694 [hydrothermal vent metagenome]|uniref:Peptidoglycan binding-like domain-containing protein n=1 Tax=hydrothermal vent metagenome TaxID=652676 RepID=A0A1W1CR81_9ZZZZ